MKNIFKSILLCSGLTLFVACEKDEDKVTMSANAQVESTLSTNTIVLDKTQSNTTVLTVSWEEKDFNVAVAPTYTVNLEYGGKVKPISVKQSPLTFTTKELNDYLLGLKVPAGTATNVTVYVKAALSDQRSIVSKKNTLNVTPFLDEIKPSEWGIAGSGANGWEENQDKDIKMWNAADGTLVAYATLTNGEIKFRKNNKWNENLGKKAGTQKELTSSGDNITVTAGTYKITLNLSNSTYNIETYSWGIVGDLNNWGNSGLPDIKMTYEGGTNSWVAKNVVIATEGSIKFRLNSDWGTNFGADSTTDPATDLEGNVTSGGKNIKVAAGTYNVSFSFDATNKGTYKIEKK